MCRLWEELLGVGTVGVEDDWYALGGHSLLAMQLARRSGYKVVTILTNPTVARLCATAPDAFQVPKSADDSKSAATMMSKGEQRLLFLHLMDPSNSAYNEPFRLEFDDGIDVLANLRRTIERTPILRTRFVDGHAVLHVNRSDNIGDEISTWESI